MKTSVIVCTYSLDRWSDLIAAVGSLQKQRVPPAEIIVVVDHNDALLERIRSQLPRVIAIANTEQQGLSGARNCGVKIARCDIVAFIDDDAVADSQWLSKIQAAYTSDSVIGAGGAIIPMWENGRPLWFPLEFDWVVGCTYFGMPHETQPVRNIIGANMSFRKEVFNRTEGFNHRLGRVGTFPAGCEETELCIRARRRWHNQAEILYVPMARVTHRVPAVRSGFSYYCSRCFAEGISKAHVAGLLETGDWMVTERSYAIRTLPRGVLRGIRDTFFHADFGGVLRAGVIMSGLAITGSGYFYGTVRRWLNAMRVQRGYA